MSFARGWGQDGWKHRQEDYIKETFNQFYKEQRRINRKSKINNIFNVDRKER
jgi:hypothetical protein